MMSLRQKGRLYYHLKKIGITNFMQQELKDAIKTLEQVQAEMLATCDSCGGVNTDEGIVKCKYCGEEMDYENNEDVSEIQNTISLLLEYNK